ncbi:MAG: hypothetical protein NT029_05440 [Armatimonadetes bacterium]|nr:hypothetical protein [Armatimonadota bacterium]
MPKTLPTGVAAALAAVLVLIIGLIAWKTLFKPVPEPPKMHPDVKVHPNMTPEEAGRIFAMPTGSR